MFESFLIMHSNKYVFSAFVFTGGVNKLTVSKAVTWVKVINTFILLTPRYIEWTRWFLTFSSTEITQTKHVIMRWADRNITTHISGVRSTKVRRRSRRRRGGESGGDSGKQKRIAALHHVLSRPHVSFLRFCHFYSVIFVIVVVVVVDILVFFLVFLLLFLLLLLLIVSAFALWSSSPLSTFFFW